MAVQHMAHDMSHVISAQGVASCLLGIVQLLFTHACWIRMGEHVGLYEQSI